mmetsp:Transcript_32882/g.51292  ORF Transcript_32882/g.51292 Transcript_32882/m.51292 type:complete len:90 (-) Transcript_32882:148-417(-)
MPFHSQVLPEKTQEAAKCLWDWHMGCCKGLLRSIKPGVNRQTLMQGCPSNLEGSQEGSLLLEPGRLLSGKSTPLSPYSLGKPCRSMLLQ